MVSGAFSCAPFSYTTSLSTLTSLVSWASFVGSADYTVVYMSESNIYITYNAYTDPAKIMYDFVKDNTDIFPDWVVERIEKLMKYEISNKAKVLKSTLLLSS